jgi:haloacetate dehalogenase
MVLWGNKGKIEQWYDPISIWKNYCSAEVRGFGINTGHYLAEEAPEEIIKCAREFLI